MNWGHIINEKNVERMGICMERLTQIARKHDENSKNYVYRVLHDNIMYFQLKPGSFVNETEIAEQLSVSRTPVREAMSRLHNDHLLDVHPQRPTMVTLLDWNMICEGVEIRRLIESSVYQEAAGYLSDEVVLKLRENLREQEYYLGINTPESMVRFQKLDLEFHRQIYYAVDRGWSWDIVTRATQHFMRYLYLNGNEAISALSYKQQKRMFKMHGALLQALIDNAPFDYFEFNSQHIFYYSDPTGEDGTADLPPFIEQEMAAFSHFFVPATELTRKRLLRLCN